MDWEIINDCELNVQIQVNDWLGKYILKIEIKLLELKIDGFKMQIMPLASRS